MLDCGMADCGHRRKMRRSCKPKRRRSRGCKPKRRRRKSSCGCGMKRRRRSRRRRSSCKPRRRSMRGCRRRSRSRSRRRRMRRGKKCPSGCDEVELSYRRSATPSKQSKPIKDDNEENDTRPNNSREASRSRSRSPGERSVLDTSARSSSTSKPPNCYFT